MSAGLFPLPRNHRRRAFPRAGAPLHVTLSRFTAWLDGPQIVPLLDAAQVPRRQWDHNRRLWCIPRTHLDDLLVIAEHRQRRNITITEEPAPWLAGSPGTPVADR